MSEGRVTNGRNLSSPMAAIGGLFAMTADAVKFIFKRPFQWREFLDQSSFVARVSLAPTLLVAIPFTVLVSFILTSCCASWVRPICRVRVRCSAQSPRWPHW
jgi:ABC-type transporter Mla maintaining outer membrane lipid asymmetry permease subunit MlaE